jgi:hypothetical protein
MSASRPTLRTIAERTGLSRAAVSYALRNDRRVSPATCARVQQIARELGYERNPLMAAVAATKRSEQVRNPALVVVVHRRLPAWAGSIPATLLGFSLRHLVLPAAEEPWSRCLHWQREGVCAAILAGRFDPGPAEPWGSMAVVSWLADWPESPWFDVVHQGLWSVMMHGAYERLRQAGVQRIGTILQPVVPRHWHDDERLGALLVDSQRWPRNPPPLLLAPAAGRDHDQRTLDWWRRHKPDGILSFIGARWAALHQGGCTARFAGLIVEPELPGYEGVAGWSFNLEGMVRASVELIDSRLRYHGQAPGRTMVVPPQWLHGPSMEG